MSFTRLLAAGRSVKGIKKDPGPYRMNQEHLLPKFEVTAPKPVAAALEDEPGPGPNQAAVDDEVAVAPIACDRKEERKKGLLLRLVKRLMWWSRRPSGSKRAAKPNRLVQGELSLDAIKVVRNDLKDSDFELVALRAGAAAGTPPVSGRSRPAAAAVGVVWNRLSARLLRQAVQDFNVVQKERGKLLSSAGSDRRSPRGA